MEEKLSLGDPSALTTQMVWREVASLKELMITHIQRIDEAVKIAHDDLVRVPTEVQKAVSGVEKEISALKDLHNEKFASINKQNENRILTIDNKLHDASLIMDEKFNSVEKQFKERDTRVEQTARDTKLAVDAALQAAEKAVAKSETSTVKQIDQQALTITNGTKSLDDKINDLKDRLTRIEGQAIGIIQTRTQNKDSWGYIVGAIGILIAIISFIISLKTK